MREPVELYGLTSSKFPNLKYNMHHGIIPTVGIHAEPTVQRLRAHIHPSQKKFKTISNRTGKKYVLFA
jgi:hypothetical protein